MDGGMGAPDRFEEGLAQILAGRIGIEEWRLT
jgi:hypothetical protein